MTKIQEVNKELMATTAFLNNYLDSKNEGFENNQMRDQAIAAYNIAKRAFSEASSDESGYEVQAGHLEAVGKMLSEAIKE